MAQEFSRISADGTLIMKLIVSKPIPGNGIVDILNEEEHILKDYPTIKLVKFYKQIGGELEQRAAGKPHIETKKKGEYI